jgi:hypothetical protein
MGVGRSFANDLMQPHPSKSADDERPNDERYEQSRDRCARSAERDVVENAEKAEISDERDEQVIEH